MAYYHINAFRVAALIAVLAILGGSATAQDEKPTLDQLFAELADPALKNANRIEEKIWREWSRSGSDALDFLLERGRAAVRAGELDEAIGHFSALIDHAPDFAEAWNARATAFFLSDKYGLSITDIEQALILNPRHFGALSGMGMILEQTGDETGALRVYERAFDLNPHNERIKTAIERLEKATAGTAL